MENELLEEQGALEPEVRSARALANIRGARRILRAGFIAAPMIAGLDKFFGRLVRWEDYLAPQFARRSPLGARGTMRVAGIVEMAAGVLVAARPRVGGYVVAGWLGGIIVNLVAARRSYDVALRDLGLAFGAIALARIDRGLHLLEQERAVTLH